MVTLYYLITKARLFSHPPTLVSRHPHAGSLCLSLYQRCTQRYRICLQPPSILLIQLLSLNPQNKNYVIHIWNIASALVWHAVRAHPFLAQSSDGYLLSNAGQNPSFPVESMAEGGATWRLCRRKLTWHLGVVLEKTNHKYDGLTSRDRTTLISYNQPDPIKLPLSMAIQSKRILISIFSN